MLILQMQVTICLGIALNQSRFSIFFKNQVSNKMRTIRHKNFKPQKQCFTNQESGKAFLPVAIEQTVGSSLLPNTTKTITISNREYRERREKLTKNLKDDLDSRDRQFLLPFQTVFSLEKYLDDKAASEETCKFQQQEYVKLRKAVYDYVSQVCQNVTSISFKFLNKGELGQSEAKAFASKTILANLQSVMTDIKAKLCSIIDVEEVNQIMANLTRQIDKFLSELFGELADHYPQAPPVGATARMKEVIVGVNRAQDQSNDLIFANNISIDKYFTYTISREIILPNPQDFTGFVMEVINKAIQITGQTVGQDETIAQKYHHFTQSLFAFADYKDCKAIIDRVKADPESDIKRQFFIHMLNNKMEQVKSQEIKQISQYKQDWKEQARKQQKYGIAQKILTHVKPFTNADIKQCNFSVNNSSVLRVMTKWAEYLEDIFEKPEQQIRQRLYDFKDYKNQPKQLNSDYKTVIIMNLQKEYVQVKARMKEMQQKNTLFQSYIISQSQRGSSYLKRFTQVRTASSQMNAFTLEFTRKYLCILIYHLIKASSSEVNLIVFRVGDLLRSKLQCTEKNFINVINTLSLLDEAKVMQGKFKLVRVKNKLSMRDNNVLINFMFMGKVQCQLQLSIQKMDKKDQNYYAFCHFLYEMTRGKLGVLTECATIVCQHDPIVSASKDKYYRPKYYEYFEKQKDLFHKIHQKNEDIYQCFKCGQLRIRENVNLFSKEDLVCNWCILKEKNPEEKLTSGNNTQSFLKYIQICSRQGKIERINSYGQIQEYKYIISIKNERIGSKFRLYKSWKPKDQSRLFLVEINQSVLTDFDQFGFDFGRIDYLDVYSKKKKNAQIKELTYIFKKINKQALQALGIQATLLPKLDLFFQAVQKFRSEKNLIKSIKTKSQIIDIRKDKQNFQVSNKVANHIVIISRRIYCGTKSTINLNGSTLNTQKQPI